MALLIISLVVMGLLEAASLALFGICALERDRDGFIVCGALGALLALVIVTLSLAIAEQP